MKIVIVLAFENSNDRYSSNIYYLPMIKIADYNVMINGINLFNKSINNKTKKVIEATKTLGSLLDFTYFSDSYKLISIDFKNSKLLMLIQN